MSIPGFTSSTRHHVTPIVVTIFEREDGFEVFINFGFVAFFLSRFDALSVYYQYKENGYKPFIVEG